MFPVLSRLLFVFLLLAACPAPSAFAQSEDPTTLNNQTSELIRAGKYREATPIADKALEAATTQNALPRIKAAALDNRALLYKFAGNFEEAERLYNEALNIQRSLPAQPNPDLPTAYNNLGLLLDAKGDYEAAKSRFERAIELWEALPDEKNAFVGKHNLAIAYHHLGLYEKSEPLFLEVVSYREKNKDAEGLAHVFNNLGLLYEHQGKYSKAKSSYNRALEAAKEAFKDEKHPMIGRIRQNLGGLYKSLGRRGEARRDLEAALEIFEQAFGKDSHWLAPILNQLGDLARLEDNCSESSKYFARARSIGSSSTKYIPVLYATDRKREPKSNKITFGDRQVNKLSIGTVVVPLSVAQPLIVQSKGKSAKSPSGRADAAQRLPQQCAGEINDLGNYFKDHNSASPKQALIFVHGYYVTFDNAIKRAAEIAYKIKFDGDVYIFSWPSQGRFWGYFSDNAVIGEAGVHLGDFLHTVFDRGNVSKLHFIAHSMGSKVLMDALERMIARNAEWRSRFGEIIFASPDIYSENFTRVTPSVSGNGNTVASAGANEANKITLYAAKSDLALWLSRWIWRSPRAGLIDDEPLIGIGFDTIDVTNGGAAVWQPFNFNHDIFAESPIVIGDMKRIVERGTRPPHERTEKFEQTQTESGKTYWQIRADNR